MKIGTFFEYFELFANTPGAVAKMRELVLELAVKGALSERLAADQNDPTWREFIGTCGEGSRDAAEWQLPFDIPSAWRWTCLDDLGTTRVRNDVEDGTRVSFIPMASVSSNYGVPAQSEERTWSEIKKGFTHFAEGDVVMAKITPCFENAKSAVMRNLINGVGAGTTELHVFRRTTEVVLPEFVLIYVKTRGFITRGEPRMTGSAGQKRVPREYFATSPFPLPPIGEQKRIVAKVDELMALCDQLEAQQQARESRHTALARASLARFADAPTPTNLNYLFHPSYSISPADLRKSVLTLAVQGKLLPQDPTDEAVEELLARNDGERRTVARDDHRADGSNQPLLSAADRWDIPDAWQWRALADLVLFVDYRGKTPVKVSNGVRLLTAKNVRKGQINLEPEEFLSDSEYTAWMTRGFPRTGDVLFTTEAPMGNAAVVLLTERFALAQRVICFQSYGAIDPEFLVLQILSERFQAILDRNGTGVTAKGIKASKLKQLPVAVPPLAEQRRVAAKVRDVMALIDTFEGHLAASSATAENLLSAVVAEVTAVA